MLAFPNLSVTANIFAGRELTGRFGWLRESEMRARARDLLARLELPVSPDAAVDTVPIAHRQLLQVARALAFDCRIARARRADDVADGGGDGSSLPHPRRPEARRRHDRVRIASAARGLPPVRSHHGAARRPVGRHVSTGTRRRPDIVQAMVGRAIPERARRAGAGLAGEPRLRVEGLTRRPCFEDVSLSIAPGEIVGLFGLVGSGAPSCSRRSSACTPADRGRSRSTAAPCRFGSPRAGRARRRRARAGGSTASGALLQSERSGTTSCCRRPPPRRLLIARAECDASGALVRDWRIQAPSTTVTPDSPERRQPAEGRPGQVARARAARAAARRADQGRRRRREVRDPRHRPRAGGARDRVPARVERPARRCWRWPTAFS